MSQQGTQDNIKGEDTTWATTTKGEHTADKEAVEEAPKVVEKR
jgi:hypothetical protein